MTTKTQTQKTTSNVNELVYSMLTENTGTHFLDSGGADGRMWQRNESKCLQDFEDENPETYEYCSKYNDIYRLCNHVLFVDVSKTVKII